MEQRVIVFCNAESGRDEELNEWYSWVHIRDVMQQTPGAIAVQRFQLAEAQFPGLLPTHRYLAVYEAESHADFAAGHAEVFTPRMPISTSFRFSDFREASYEPLAEICTTTDRTGALPLITERFPATPNFTEWYLTTRLPQLAATPGVTETLFTHLAAEQMLPPPEDAHYVTLTRTNDLAVTIQSWPAALIPAQRACYTPLFPRLTAHAARHPTPADAARAQAARAALGPNTYSALPTF